MRELVINGAHQYPGANKVQKASGEIISLDQMKPHQRLAESKKLFNPTVEEASKGWLRF